MFKIKERDKYLSLILLMLSIIAMILSVLIFVGVLKVNKDFPLKFVASGYFNIVMFIVSLFSFIYSIITIYICKKKFPTNKN